MAFLEIDETQPLLQSAPAPAASRTRAPLILAASLVLAGVAGTMFSVPRRGAAALVGASDSAVMSINIVSEYEDKPGQGYWFVDATRFVEPQRTSTVNIAGTSSTGAALSTCAYTTANANGASAEGGPWDHITGVETAKDFARTGTTDTASFTVRYPSPAQYKLTVSCEYEDGEKALLETELSCYYVRRELRDLTTRDRELFLDSFVTLYKTPTAEGVKTYGKNYRSITDLCAMHLRAAGTRDTDHIHDGLALVTQHVAMTMEFELSLQSVAPRLAVPYWDYTIDATELQTKYPGEYYTSISKMFYDSNLFTDQTFGRTDPTTSHVEEGRMAQMTIARDFDFEVKSSRGFLRAPWNINPSAKVTRFHSICGADEVTSDSKGLIWPTCAVHLSTITEFDSWYDWSWNAGYVPHGPVHSWIGGVGGGDCDEKFTALVTDGYMDESYLADFKLNAFTRLKNAWRDELIEVPKYCSEDAPVSECMWTCVEDIATNDYTVGLLGISGITSNKTGLDNFAKIAKTAFCTTAYWPGDMFEAASPAEASFWPIHPTMERLLVAKDLMQPFTDKEWVTSNGRVCQYTSTSDCKGHHAGDLTFFKSTVKKANGAYKTVHLTNEELRHAIMPATGAHSVSYIYAHFRWSHCDTEGVVFPEA